MRLLRFIVFFALLWAGPARALITIGDDSLFLQPPADGAPWDHVAQVSGNASAIYLGNGFLLTANHVNIAASLPVFLDNVRYDLDPTYGDHGILVLAGVDLKILKIAGDPGLAPLPLAAAGDLDTGHSATFIGWGVGKGSEVANQGWLWGDNSTIAQRWGTNRTENGIAIGEDGSGNPNSTFLQTSFDADQGDSEAQLTLGDSGGGLFEKSGGVWKLAGLADLAPAGHAYYDNDPATPGNQPDAGYYLRLETYRDQILAATNVPEPATGLSLMLGGSILAAGWGRAKRRPGGGKP